MPVLDLDTDQTLEYHQLHHHPKYQRTRKQSYFNKLGSLCQGIGTYPSRKGPCLKGTGTLIIIRYENIPADWIKDVTYKKVVCKLKPHKDDPNRTHITIGKNRICYHVNVGTPTGSLEMFQTRF